MRRPEPSPPSDRKRFGLVDVHVDVTHSRERADQTSRHYIQAVYAPIEDAYDSFDEKFTVLFEWFNKAAALIST